MGGDRAVEVVDTGAGGNHVVAVEEQAVGSHQRGGLGVDLCETVGAQPMQGGGADDRVRGVGQGEQHGIGVHADDPGTRQSLTDAGAQ
ncbi:hypothetical protein [Nocardia sp. NPDC051570]|uniref:hypothetical protein n=1 Tax=Nocardia sp. NPDC051570 TaxID=3364324 RepID=UPI003795FCEF